MTDIEWDLDAKPKSKFENAKKLLLETDNAIQSLTFEERQKLAHEFAKYKGIYNLYQII